MPIDLPSYDRPPRKAVVAPPALPLAEAPQRGARAFSLVELLMAISVFSLLVVILASVAQNVSDVWLFTQKRTSRQQSARAVMDFITRDLQCALPPIVPNSATSLQMVRNPSSLASAPGNGYRSGDTLFWQTPATSDTSQGDIAIVGYFIRWTTSNKALLCRLFIPPGVAAGLIADSPNDWVNQTIITNWAPADSGKNYLGLMSEYVVGFWAEPLDAHGGVIPLANGATFDSRLGYIDSRGATVPSGSFPSAIRVSIATLDPRSAARLSSSLQGKANAVANAEAFVASVLADNSFKAIHAGIHAHTATITLTNAR
jgi:prepilin-type N-terminal cleavage/methylation domain-containing protein